MATRRRTYEKPMDPEVRAFLIDEAFHFVDTIRSMPGIERIALIGSLTTHKPNPKDADVLVTIADDLDLTELATASRRLKGRAQTKNRGADIFLANGDGQYIGRICHWRECRPFIRMACEARHCGQRMYLSDDLDSVNLSTQLIDNPPVLLWPRVAYSGEVPVDLLPHLAELQSKIPAD